MSHIDEGITRIDQTMTELRQVIVASEIDTAVIQALENRNMVIGWLGTTDPSSNHYAACKRRQPGTGKWFIEGSCMESWKKPDSLLWLHGIRSCYPTHLLSSCN